MLNKLRAFLRTHKFFSIFTAAALGFLLTTLIIGFFQPDPPPEPKAAPLAAIVKAISAEKTAETIKEVKIEDVRRTVTVVYKDEDKASRFSSYPTDYGSTILDAAEKSGVKVKVSNELITQSGWAQFFSFLPLILIIGLVLLLVISTTGGKGGNKPISNIPTVRFKDLAGVDEAVEDMGEITDFLRSTERFKEIGAKSPKGALLSGPPGTGKALHKHTLIPLAAGGFKTVGEIEPGEAIVDDQGKPTNVTAKFQPKEAVSYELTFTGGVKVQASASHLWATMQADGRKLLAKGSLAGEKVLTTQELFERFATTKRTDSHGNGRKLGSFSVRTNKAVAYPKTELPFDPYLLGLWLGDGYSHESRVTGMISDLEIYQHEVNIKQRLRIVEIKPAAYNNYKRPFGYLSIDANDEHLNDFRRWLKSADLYKNKHIPSAYLYAAIDSRKRLLAGMLDTDGTVNKSTGAVSVSTSVEAIADQIQILVSSLGMKASKYTSTTTRKDTGKTHTGYNVVFYPDFQVFKLPRKQEILNEFIPGFAQNVNHKVRFLEEINEIDANPEDFYCFTVDSPSHLFLCTESFVVTHNTMLAKAVAGESGVPFYQTSGSDFVELFVGMGARRVRTLFKAAKKHDRAIIFIDEIDTIGGRRGQDSSSESREHSRTINALLTEMDGFEDSNVIVIAATNNPDSLDAALVRAGRFDRKIAVDLPDWKGRQGILEIHSQGRPLAEDVDLVAMAKSTTGLSGAELANLINEALINAVRNERKAATQEDFMEALSVVTLGRARLSAVITPNDRKVTAIHEAGHAVVGLALDELPDPSHVTVVPRGMSGGHTKLQESEDRFQTATALRARLAMMMGGLAAERLMMGDITQGPGSDLAVATDLAQRMVSKMGMGTTLSVVADQSIVVNGPVGQEIQAQAEKILAEAVERAHGILSNSTWRVVFDEMTKRLMDADSMDTEEIQELKRMADKV